MDHDGKGGLGLLVHQVRSGELDREGFLRAAREAGVTEERAAGLADDALAACENQRRLRENPRESHDYIVIGAGSAGCVLAARLSEDPANQVLVLEAGGPGTHPDVFIPSRWKQLLGTELDWNYQTVPQRHAADRIVPCPRGKMLGGCAANNASVWVRGHRLDYEGWAAQGNPGWDAETVRRIYKELEDYSGGEDEYRGVGGPLRISRATDPHPLALAFIEGAKQTGIPTTHDSIIPGLIRPASRGSMRLASADPSAPPILDMNYLGHEADVEALRVAVELSREIGASRAFDGFRKRELMPGPLGRAGMVEWIRKATTCFFHPTSTCRMGVDDRAVVDPRLRVHGLEGLRVADASIMPEITSGPTNAPAILIGEQASRFILETWHG